MCTLQWQDRSDFNDLGQMSDYAKQFIRRGDAFKIGITANPERKWRCRVEREGPVDLIGRG